MKRHIPDFMASGAPSPLDSLERIQECWDREKSKNKVQITPPQAEDMAKRRAVEVERHFKALDAIDKSPAPNLGWRMMHPRPRTDADTLDGKHTQGRTYPGDPSAEHLKANST